MNHSEVRAALREFVSERDWSQFHTPSNLAKSIAVESGELLECFQWTDDPTIDDVSDELADILTYCYLLADALALDVDRVVADKLAKTRAKYPVETSRGVSTKYDRL